jgi:alcohol dehydrogenase (cytochrome c)
MTLRSRSPFVLTALVVAMSFSGTAMAKVTEDDIRNDAMTTDQIVTNGLGTMGQRYSTLSMLNDSNVGQL